MVPVLLSQPQAGELAFEGLDFLRSRDAVPVLLGIGIGGGGPGAPMGPSGEQRSDGPRQGGRGVARGGGSGPHLLEEEDLHHHTQREPLILHRVHAGDGGQLAAVHHLANFLPLALADVRVFLHKTNLEFSAFPKNQKHHLFLIYFIFKGISIYSLIS